MNVRTHDVSAEYASYFERHRLFEAAALPAIGYAPVRMAPAERLFLWTLAYSTRPAAYLEIGSLEGGSALLVASALDALGAPGRLALIEPAPRIRPEVWTRLAPRATLVQGLSPAAIPEAAAALGRPIELALIDGDHAYEAVRADAEGLLPHLAPDAYLLFHDAFFPAVERAIDDLVAARRDRLADCGAVTREVTRDPAVGPDGPLWGGLRMLRAAGP